MPVSQMSLSRCQKFFPAFRNIILLFLLFLGVGVIAEAAEKKIKVALAGSSACEGYGNTDPKLIFGWGEVIGNYFKPDVEILNFGKGGYSTKWFIERGKWAKLLKSKPDYILMTLGANDAKKDRGTDAKTEYRDNLRRFAADAKKINARIIFVTLNQSMHYSKKKDMLVFDRNGRALRRDRIPYSQAIREVSAELKLPCLELFDNQQKAMEKMGQESAGKLYRYFPAKNGAGKYGKLDPSHTNLAGARFIAQIIIEELLKSNSSLRNYVDKSKLAAEGVSAGK